MNHPSLQRTPGRWRSKRPNPVPRVLLIILLFALPMVLIPVALEATTKPERAHPLNPRDELNRVLAEQGVVLGQERPDRTEEIPVEVAGIFAWSTGVDPPAVYATDESLELLDDDDEDVASDEDDSIAAFDAVEEDTEN